MSRETIVNCDHCGRRADPNNAEINVVVGRETDAAGSADNVWRTVDLCAGCQRGALGALLGQLDHADRSVWVALWGKRKEEKP